MKGFRKAFVGGCLSLLTAGLLVMLSGCDDKKNDGSAVPVNQAEQEQHNKAMMDYMQGKSAKKAGAK